VALVAFADHKSGSDVEDDVVLAMLTTCDRLTIAALGANAGAGGAMMPLACDRIIVRDGIVLNPHYQTMGLHGSEYWTYSLPKRVGRLKAIDLTKTCLPINAKSAARIGLIDTAVACDFDAFESYVTAYAETLARSEGYSKLLATKQDQRRRDEPKKPLSLYRHEELSEMRQNFWGKDDAYHAARFNFVHKVSCGKTPLRLAQHRRAAQSDIQRLRSQGCSSGNIGTRIPASAPSLDYGANVSSARDMFPT
jgi:putative two-component system hydrogenase maturation factor HypX/HoxX